MYIYIHPRFKSNKPPTMSIHGLESNVTSEPVQQRTRGRACREDGQVPGKRAADEP